MASPTLARKGSSAYEKGVREGRAMAVKSRTPEPEEAEEEEGEEEEEMDGGMKPPSRKRSAKGAKNTKAPMDGGMYGKKPMDAECGCKGKKGGKCDGNCGGSMRKRGDAALTPHEYLSACDLGIQDRSRSYIRARLDAAERLDLKCGKGSISKGEKCSKGPAQRVNPNANYSLRGRAKAEAKSGAIKGALMGAAGGFIAGALTGKPGAGLAQAAAGAGAGALYGAGAGALRGAGGAALNRAGRAYSRNRANIKKANTAIAAKNPKWQAQYAEAKAAGASNKELTNLSIKQAGEMDRILNRSSTQIWTNSNRSWASADRARAKRRDSPYAAGFSLDTAALEL